MKIRLVGKNLEDIRPLLALADFAEAGEGETPELVVTHGGDGALLGAARDYPQLPILPVPRCAHGAALPAPRVPHPARSVPGGPDPAAAAADDLRRGARCDAPCAERRFSS